VATDFDEFEAAGWEATAAGFDRYWRELTGRLVAPLLDAVDARPGSRVLDVACGPGDVAGQAAARGARATGLDIAEAMCVQARRHHPSVTFRQGDAHALPFPDGAFDAVVASLAVPHFGRPEHAVAEFRRVLASGGRVALTTWDAPERARLVGVLVDAVREVGVVALPEIPAGPDFFRFADPAAFEALVGGAGFTDVEVSTVAFVHDITTSDELWNGLLRGTVRSAALVRGQPADVENRIRAAFDRRLDDHRTGSGFAVPVSFLMATGRS
jgi:SAM-dependent methyltransferase